MQMATLMCAMLLQAAKAASPAPAPPEPAGPAVRAALREVLQWPEECEQEHLAALRALEVQDGRVRRFELGQGQALIEVACARAAYQESYRYFLLDESVSPAEGVALALPSRELDDEQRWTPVELPEIAGEASVDARRRTLRVLTRARGLGDCGTRATWRVDVRQRRLELVELLGRECDGDPEQAPPVERWPRIFPAPSPRAQ